MPYTMQLQHYFLFSALMLLLSCQPQTNESSSNQSAMLQKMDIPTPVASVNTKTFEEHGTQRTDDYYWLRERENQEVIDYLESENAYTDQMMEHTKALQDELFQEMKGRIKETDESVPYKVNGYYYITRYEEGQEYPIYSRKKGELTAAEEIMLNVNELAKDFSYYNVAGRSVSPDNKILAYGEDTLSRRIYTIRFKNLETGEMLTDVIPNTGGGATWANDNQHLFYTVKDPETLRQYQIWRHKLGTPASEDVLIFEEKDETFLSFVYKTKSKKYIVIGSYQTISTEYQVLEADNPTGTFRMVQERERGLEYSIAHYQDKFFIRTNLDAPNFRLMSTPDDQTTKDNWSEVIPHRQDVLFEGMDIFSDFMVLSERKNGITQLRVRPWEGEEHYIDFPEEAYVAGTSANPEFDTDLVRLSYESMTTPEIVYDYDAKTKDFAKLKQQEVLGEFNQDDYISERRFATARDGAKVPLSIVYHKDFKKDGSEPLLLYAYGSYGSSMEPWFSSNRISLLNRGFAFVIAHIRGGEEMGRHWYEDGKLLNKKNTFRDFIDCAEFLAEEKYASKDLIFAQGGSAGGLLMGAITNMRPDLWKGVLSAVPFVDVVTTMMDETIPLTTFEYDEWGNPNDKEYYDYMLSYSPYDQLEAKDYPAILVTTGLHDSQVQYWEPAKYVAKMRAMKTDGNPLLLHTNMDGGHGGASGRFRRLKELALQYAFIVDLAGKNKIEG